MNLPVYSTPASAPSEETTRIIVRDRLPGVSLVTELIEKMRGTANALVDAPTNDDLKAIQPGDIITSESGTERLITRVVSVDDGKIELEYSMTQRVYPGDMNNRFNRLNGEPLTEQDIAQRVQIGEEIAYNDPKIEAALELGHATIESPKITVKLEDKVTSHGKIDHIVISSERHEIITMPESGTPWMRQILKAPQAA